MGTPLGVWVFRTVPLGLLLVVKHVVIRSTATLFFFGAAVAAGAPDMLFRGCHKQMRVQGPVDCQRRGRCPCWGSDWLEVVAIDSALWMCHAESAMTGLPSPLPFPCLSSCGGTQGKRVFCFYFFPAWVFSFPVPDSRARCVQPSLSHETSPDPPRRHRCRTLSPLYALRHVNHIRLLSKPDR